MTTKTYSTRGNANAGARAKLGKDAKLGTHFTVSPVGDGTRFTWEAVDAAPKAKRTRKEGAARVSDQPQCALILKLCRRKTGASIAELAAALGPEGKPLEEHTIRGAMSRMRKQDGVVFQPIGEGRRKNYHVAVGEAGTAA